MAKSQISNLKSPGFRVSAGFTILELLVVIAIMAVLATLATGAAIKSVKQGRVRKVEATCRALEMALVNYRAQKGTWPCDWTKLEEDDSEYSRRHFKELPRYWAHGEDNKKVFKNVYHGPQSANETAYLDASALLVLYKGSRKPLREVLKTTTDVPLIYPDPNDPSKTRYFCIEYNEKVDSVKVYLEEETHRAGFSLDSISDSFYCPKWKK